MYPKIFKKNHILIALFLVLAVQRLFLMINIDAYDPESITRGLMSKHLIEGDDYSIFDYSHAYDGSVVFKSIIAVPLNLFFGMSLLSMKMIPLFIYLLLFVFLFLFIEHYYNKNIAIITSLLLIFSPWLFTYSSFSASTSHFDGIFFSIIMMALFFQISYSNKKTTTHFILFGISSGLGIWIYPTPMIMLLTCFIFWFAFDKKFFLKNNFFIFLASFIIGFLPRIYYKLTYHPQSTDSIRYFIYGDITSNLNQFVPAAKRLLFKLIPYSLFDSEHLILAYGYYFIALIGFITIFYLNRKSILNLLKGLTPSEKFNIEPKKISKETFFIIYPIIFLGIFSFMAEGLTSPPWRLITIQPFIFIIISIFLVWLWNKRLKVISLLIILFLLSTGVYGNLMLLRGANYKGEATESISKLISFLDNKNIKYVYSDSSISLPLIFASNEKIIAYHEMFDDVDPDFRYPRYNELVNNATDYAFVYYKDSTINKLLELYLNEFNVSYQMQIIDGKVVYYSLSKTIRPGNFNTNNIFIKGSMGDQLFKSRLNTKQYKRFDLDNNQVVYILTGTS